MHKYTLQVAWKGHLKGTTVSQCLVYWKKSLAKPTYQLDNKGCMYFYALLNKTSCLFMSQTKGGDKTGGQRKECSSSWWSCGLHQLQVGCNILSIISTVLACRNKSPTALTIPPAWSIKTTVNRANILVIGNNTQWPKSMQVQLSSSAR